MGSRLSKSDITPTREQELATRQRAASLGDQTRCQHFAPGTSVVLSDETFEADAARTPLRLRAADSSQRVVLRPGS